MPRKRARTAAFSHEGPAKESDYTRLLLLPVRQRQGGFGAAARAGESGHAPWRWCGAHPLSGGQRCGGCSRGAESVAWLPPCAQSFPKEVGGEAAGWHAARQLALIHHPSPPVPMANCSGEHPSAHQRPDQLGAVPGSEGRVPATPSWPASGFSPSSSGKHWLDRHKQAGEALWLPCFALLRPVWACQPV